MLQPAIDVRPIREMTGRAIFNEVFLAGARILADDVLGEVGSGWGVALTTLANERTMLGASSFGSAGRRLSIRADDPSARAGDLARATEVAAEAAAESGAGALLRRLLDEYGRCDDPLFRQEVARLHSLLEIARYTDLRVRAAVDRGGRPGPEVSVGKLAASRLMQELHETMFRLCGPFATLWGEDSPKGGRVHEVGFSSYLISIGGGTDQVQRNIIGERVLGLPA